MKIVKNSETHREIAEAFQNMMGINGDSYVQEILETGKLSPNSFEEISDNVSYNSRESVCKYFGIVWYYAKMAN